MFFGRDDLRFTARSDTLPGVFRTFTSLTACADEVGMSRIYGGIHFQFANLEGKRSGEAVARYVAQNYLLPLEALPRLVCDGVREGRLHVLLHGRPGFRYALEAAAELAGAWTRVGEEDARAGGVRFLVEMAAVPAMQLLRAVELGPGGTDF